MKLCVPTNWDNELIEGLSKLNNIYELYGSLPFGIVPGGRAPFSLPQITREQAEEHIKLAKSKGMKFNYVMNAGSFMNQEYTKEGREKIAEYVSWAVSAGVDSITVGVPVLVEYIKKKFPDINVNASIQLGLSTPIEVKRYEKLGVDRVILRKRCNRDFKLLSEIRKSVNIDLCVFPNLDCVYQCAMMNYHLSLPNHVLQKQEGEYVMYIDYPKISCSLIKALNPVEFIKGSWIRPEDLKEYESLGIEYFKLVDRRMPTEKILKIAEAYSKREYKGNLIDLFYYLPPIKGFCNQIKKQLPEVYDKINCEDLSKIEIPKINIDNTKLNGFLNFFKDKNCNSGCEGCDYCDKIVKESVKIEDQKQFDDYAVALKTIKKEVYSLG